MGPEGEPFDAGRDYVGEWSALRVRPSGGPPGGPEAGDLAMAAEEQERLSRALRRRNPTWRAALNRLEVARAHEDQAPGARGRRGSRAGSVAAPHS